MAYNRAHIPTATILEGESAMSSDGSVSRWIGPLQNGDPAAAQQLWERYFLRLVGLARVKLQNTPRRAADEEDVALSAFDSFCRGAAQGRFPQLNDRDNLWALLVTITIRKACQLARHEGRQKRGSKAVLDEAALVDQFGCIDGQQGLEQISAREPTPEFAAQMADECRHLFALLPNAELRSVAQWKLEGDTNAEMATKLDCGLRSIERKLRLIRNLWSQIENTP
jgi:DNA-directed RNA polymerase specialized sigma24 family protein